MATKLKSFDFTNVSRLTTSDKATYPWDDWFDGDIWQIDQGTDFDGHPLMMERIIRTRATGKNAHVTLRHIPVNGDPWGSIVLQRTDVEGPESAKRRATSEKRAATRAANGKTKPKGAKAAEVSKAKTRPKPEVRNGPPVKKVASKIPSKRLATV